jgi:hypothetical protein
MKWDNRTEEFKRWQREQEAKYGEVLRKFAYGLLCAFTPEQWVVLLLLFLLIGSAIEHNCLRRIRDVGGQR